jgi:hypothetical protein
VIEEGLIDSISAQAANDVARDEPELGVEVDGGRGQGLGQLDLAGPGMGFDRNRGMGQMMRERIQVDRRSAGARRSFRPDGEGELR